MTTKPEETPPEALSAALRAAAEDVPEDVASQLQEARRRAALAADAPRGRRLKPVIAVGAGAAVAAFALAIGLQLSAPGPAGPAELPLLPAGSEQEFAAAQELDLLEELEFIAWLEEADRGAG